MPGHRPLSKWKCIFVAISTLLFLSLFSQATQRLFAGVPELVRRPSLLGEKYERPYMIDVDRPIDGMLNWYLDNRLARAEAYGADLVIIRLTTPGGDLEYSLKLSRQLRDIQWAKVVVWIPKEAISGGAIISLGADAIYMQPSAMIGDAGVIMLGPNGEFQFAEEKIVSYVATSVSEIALSTGLPPAVAEAMVDRKLKVYEATHKESGASTFLNESQANDPEISKVYDIGAPIAEAGNDRFLTVAAPRAKELQLCDEVFDTEDQFLRQLCNIAPRLTTLDWKDQLVYILNRPWLTALLLVMGIVGLYWEMSAPGMGLPGLVSLFCFSIFFWSHFLGGTAGWFEVLMFCLGITCLMMEIFVLPGFGVFGISGIAMIGIGLLMATQDFLVPETPLQWQELRTNSISVLGAFVILGLLIAVQVFVFDTIPGLGRFQLKPEEQLAVDSERSEAGGHSGPNADWTFDSDSVSNGANLSKVTNLSKGDWGICQSDLRPSGKVLIGDRLVDVLTEGDYVERGTQVSVIRIEGNIVTVRRMTPVS